MFCVGRDSGKFLPTSPLCIPQEFIQPLYNSLSISSFSLKSCILFNLLSCAICISPLITCATVHLTFSGSMMPLKLRLELHTAFKMQAYQRFAW